MNKELKEILLDIFRREEKAAQVQESRGGYDIGRRSAVTAGKHFDPLAEYISKELQTYGVASESIFWNEKLNIPGWFRASKQWDMLAFYLDRCRIFCDRLLQERVYDAVWLVYVDVEHEDVEEPLVSLSYEQFMHRIKSQVELFR